MFEIGKIYKRSVLHDQLGGNRQGGIANCKQHPIIFIFTGKAGEQHGYEDGWDGGNFFHYTGEGQRGDMTFTKGNKALLDHQNNGKEVYLFESASPGLWRFIDQVELVDFSYFPTPDSSGTMREGIKFKFKSATAQSTNRNGEARKAYNYNKPNKTERRGLVTSRVGQGWYRKCLMEKWENKCAVTGLDVTGLLIASHIVPWKEADDEQRLDPENGILLSPNLDALFDSHLISFEDQGNIVLSNKLREEQYRSLGVHKGMRLMQVTAGMIQYLKSHRQILEEKTQASAGVII